MKGTFIHKLTEKYVFWVKRTFIPALFSSHTLFSSFFSLEYCRLAIQTVHFNLRVKCICCTSWVKMLLQPLLCLLLFLHSTFTRHLIRKGENNQLLQRVCVCDCVNVFVSVRKGEEISRENKMKVTDIKT